MIRKCGNCVHYNYKYNSCSIYQVTSAYEHEKKIFLTVGENLYCDRHQFRNEDLLKREAVVVELESLSEAMKMISEHKIIKQTKKNYNAN